MALDHDRSIVVVVTKRKNRIDRIEPSRWDPIRSDLHFLGRVGSEAMGMFFLLRLHKHFLLRNILYA